MDGVAVAAPQPWRFVFVNSTLSNWLDGSPGQYVGRPVPDVLRATPADALLGRLERAWRGEGDDAALSACLLNREGDGTELPVEVLFSRIALGERVYVGIVVRRVATERMGADRRDPLTGLADRSLLMARLSMLLAGDRSADQRFAVLFIDLDDFKRVNDRYGHLIGDRVLGEVGRRLAHLTRMGDLVVRYGGDEFVALVEQVAGWENVEPVIRRIHAALAKPIAIPAGEITLTASIGVAEASAKHRTPEDLLNAADRAMYAVKRRVAQRSTP